MRDIVLRYPEEEEEWDYDIEVQGGYPVYVYQESNTSDQRAAIAAALSKGSVPGNTSLGIDWGNLLVGNSNLIVIDNQVKRLIQALAGEGTIDSITQYVPIYKNNGGSIKATVYRV